MAHVLVLDDEPDACNLVKRIAEGMKHKAVAFEDENEAITYCGSNEVDLAILDLKLRKMTGLDVLEKLKEFNPRIKALLLTGYPTMETAKRAFGLGVHAYLTKPIDVDDLESKIASALEKTGNDSKETLTIE
ncbi:MAG: response regulator [Desulfomonilaceae bacterium]